MRVPGTSLGSGFFVANIFRKKVLFATDVVASVVDFDVVVVASVVVDVVDVVVVVVVVAVFCPRRASRKTSSLSYFFPRFSSLSLLLFLRRLRDQLNLAAAAAADFLPLDADFFNFSGNFDT